MTDQIESSSKNKFIYMTFNSKISKDTLIVLKDQDDKIITAYKTNRDISNLLYSSEDLEYDSYKVYTGGDITGEEFNGLYTSIDKYSNGEEVSVKDVSNNMNTNNKKGNFILKLFLIELVLSIIYLILIIVFRDKIKNSD
jgi:hypothetical protein